MPISFKGRPLGEDLFLIQRRRPSGYPKLYRIGEVMRYTGMSRQTLHNYTMMGLITAAERTESGHRLYPESVFGRLERIEMLKRHRTLGEVKKLLDRKGPGSGRKKVSSR